MDKTDKAIEVIEDQAVATAKALDATTITKAFDKDREAQLAAKKAKKFVSLEEIAKAIDEGKLVSLDDIAKAIRSIKALNVIPIFDEAKLAEIAALKQQGNSIHKIHKKMGICTTVILRCLAEIKKRGG